MKHLYFAAMLALLAGCDTTSRQIQQEQLSQRQTIQELQEQQESLNVNLQSTQEENARLRQQIEELRAELESSRQTSSTYASDIHRLDELVHKMNSSREKDRQAILDEVSRELARISQKTAAAAPPPARQASSDSGYEHVVKKGQTLFGIAKAYGVSASRIAQANKIQVKTPLKAGQVLFIPEK
jgi:LysM repeat protein